MSLELIAIGGIALLLFGPKIIPKTARTLGKTTKEPQRGREESTPDD